MKKILILLLVLLGCAHFETRKASVYAMAQLRTQAKVRVLNQVWTGDACIMFQVGDEKLEKLRIPPDAKWCIKLESMLPVPAILGDEKLCQTCFDLPSEPKPVKLEEIYSEIEGWLVDDDGTPLLPLYQKK